NGGDSPNGPDIRPEIGAAEPKPSSAPEITAFSFHGLPSARMIALLPLDPKDYPPHGEVESLVYKMLRAMKLDPDGEVFLISWDGSRSAEEVAANVAAYLTGGKPVVLFAHGPSLHASHSASHSASQRTSHAASAAFTGLQVAPGEWFSWNGARV